MKIADFIDAAAVIPNLKGGDKRSVLEEMVRLAASHYQLVDATKLLDILLEREKTSSTAIGEGVAIPHGKISGISQILGVFARSPQGVDFQAQDGSLTHLFFLLLAPLESASDHLKALARISRLLKDASFRSRLMKEETKEGLLKMILDGDGKL
ncbi:MAG: PTS sugar transporter subunit IIA [Candidatus Binatia bacterium]|nr:PTS sugar transporter subunit IIA [Candidatus Binatia bacterium]